jgi:hypothetical protein
VCPPRVLTARLYRHQSFHSLDKMLQFWFSTLHLARFPFLAVDSEDMCFSSGAGSVVEMLAWCLCEPHEGMKERTVRSSAMRIHNSMIG